MKSLFKKKTEPIIDIDAVIKSESIESEPINFGEKSTWVCVRTNNLRELINSFKLEDLKKGSWSEGFKREYDDYVFTVGPIGEWIIQYGWMQKQPNYNDGMDEIHKYLNRLSTKFGEAQYFLCQRTTDTAIWAKSFNGEIIRSYCNGDSIFLQYGEMTEIEKEIGIINKSLDELSEKQAEDYLFPGIDEVLNVASNWSVNPNELKNNDDVPRNGYMLKPIKGILELKDTITNRVDGLD